MARRPADLDPRRLQGIPRVKWVNTAASDDLSDASDAIFLASGYRLIPDPWQVEIINAWMARRRDSKWRAKTAGLACPRQNGKNGAIEVRELFGLVVIGEYILHTAHEIKTSRKAFKRLKHFFGEKRDDPNAKFPELNSLVVEVRNTNGQEAIQLKDIWRVDGTLVRSIGRPTGDDVEFVARGGLIEFGTRTGGGGRGTTYDLLIIDEAQHLSEEDLAAVRPTISSGALGNSQIIYLGTPPDPDKLSAGFGEAWTRIRGNAGKVKTQCWIEYGAPDGPRPDPDDTDLLYACNPSLGLKRGDGSHGLDFETIDGERTELSPDGYARERLGWWGNPEAGSHRGVIDMDQWRALKFSGDHLPSRGLIVVDCSPDLAWTTIALATDGPTSGRPLGLVDRDKGSNWVVASVKHLITELSSVLEVCLTPSAKHLSAALIDAKIPIATRGKKSAKATIEHKILSPAEVGAGCSAFQQMVTDGELSHVDQAELNTAVRHAITHYVGEVQMWERRNATIDVSPLVAVSVALQRWAALVAVPPEEKGVPRRHTGTAPRPEPVHAARGRANTRRPSSPAFDPRTSGF